MGISGLLVFGFIGSLFGAGGMVFGGFIGLLIGISFATDRNVKATKNLPALKTKYSTSNQSPSGIIRKSKNAPLSFLLIAALIAGIFFFNKKDEPKGIDVVSVAGWVANNLLRFNPAGLLRKAMKK